MDFTLPPEIEDIRSARAPSWRSTCCRSRPIATDYDDHENIRLDCLRATRARRKPQGLWAPQAPKDFGGMGLPIVGWAAMYEEANRSIFGPVCFNCAAPDDGNMNLLALVGTPAQKDKWLRPIVEGKVRSAFAMTEPAPGGGSDPGMIRTRAEKKGDRWVIHGHKWFITGAGVADHFILVARTSDDPRRGLTAFLFHRDQPGWRDRAAHPDHGAGGARRPLRARVRRPRGPRRERADEARRRAARHADQARAGAAHALHALARASPSAAARSRRPM